MGLALVRILDTSANELIKSCYLFDGLFVERTKLANS